MNLGIRYLTEYRYESSVTDNLNALRVQPANTATQRVDDFGVRVDPETRLHQHLDYFGTTVIEFGISRPHEHLSIDVRARVKTATPDDPPAAPWGELAAPAYAAEAGEFLLPDGSEPDELVLDELVGLSRAETPLAAVRRLVELCRDLKIRTVAEMVETLEVEEIVRHAGVDFAQGWLYGKPADKPMPALRPSAPIKAVARRAGASDSWG